jgi:hypothetical protein
MSSSGAKSAAGKKSKPKNFECPHPDCGKNFLTHTDLIRHSNRHTGGENRNALLYEYTKKLDAFLLTREADSFCEIPLSDGYGCGAYTVVSKKRYSEVYHHSWHSNAKGYPQAAFIDSLGHQKTVQLHTTLLKSIKCLIVCHLDQNPLNNTDENLMYILPGLNSRNIGIRSTNTSGYSGVGFNERRGKWYSRIQLNGKRRYLGLFENSDDGKIAAAEKWDMAIVERWPYEERVFLNFPDKRAEYLHKLGFATTASE